MELNTIITEFQQLPTGTIADALEDLHIPNCVIIEGPKLLNCKTKRMAGVACTIQQMPKRSVNPGKARQWDVFNTIAKKGEIVVIEAGGRLDSATNGGLQATRAMVRGLAGVVINGCCRDAEDLVDMELPVFSLGSNPRKSVPLETVGINVPIAINNVQIRPGDLIIGDLTGLVVIPVEIAEKVLQRSKFQKALEDEMEKCLKAGEDFVGLRQRAEEKVLTSK